MQITFLGTGTSHGVPTIDCLLDDYARCPLDVCRKAAIDPRHRRSRSSLHVLTESASFLVDTSQDFRQQMLTNRIKRIDAVLFTHGHADHIYGLPDIRSYCRHQGDAIDIYGSRETLDILRTSFAYIFSPSADYIGGGIPALRPHPVQGPLRIAGSNIVPIPVEHGNLKQALGYRIGGLAYLPDVKHIPESSLALLAGLDLLVLNCLRLRPHGSHLCLQESLAYAEQIAPRHCLFTHMAHDIDYQALQPGLPAHYRFAYDGLTLEI